CRERKKNGDGECNDAACSAAVADVPVESKLVSYMPSVRAIATNTRKTNTQHRGCRIPPDWAPSSELVAWAKTQIGLPADAVSAETDRFRDHFESAPGAKGIKLDWGKTWKNWMRTFKERR